MIKMEDKIFKILSKSGIYFCKVKGNPSTTSQNVMMDCFDVFIIEEGWFFYRLTEDCYDRGYLDENEYLIGPCEGYDKMICMAKLFDESDPVDFIDSPSWIEEEEFRLNKRKGTLKDLIQEMCEIDREDQDGQEDQMDQRDQNSRGDRDGHEDQPSDLSEPSDSSELSQPSEDDLVLDEKDTQDKPQDISQDISQNIQTKGNFEHGHSSSDESSSSSSSSSSDNESRE